MFAFAFIGSYITVLLVSNGYYYYSKEIRDSKPIPYNRCSFDNQAV